MPDAALCKYNIQPSYVDYTNLWENLERKCRQFWFMPDAATLPQEQTSVEGQAEVHRPPEHGEEVSATSVWLYALLFEFLYLYWCNPTFIFVYFYLCISICVFEYAGTWRDGESTIYVDYKHDVNMDGWTRRQVYKFVWVDFFLPGEDMEPPGVEIKSWAT